MMETELPDGQDCYLTRAERMGYNGGVADALPDPPATTTATANVNLTAAQYKMLMRLQQLQREAGDAIMRVELDLTRDRIILVDRRIVRREIFS